MGYADFPHLNFETMNFHELIKMVKECRDNYANTLSQITALDNRLTQYESNVNQQIDGSIKSALDKYNVGFTASIENQFQQINQSLSAWKLNTENDLQKSVASMQQDIQSMQQYIQNMQAQVNATLSKFNEKIISNNSDLMQLTDAYFTEIMTTLDKLLNNFVEQINGEIQQIKETLPTEINSIEWLWNYAVDYGCYTCLEWYNDTITCQQWNESNITCAQWHTSSKEVFNWYNRVQRLISAISGEVVSPQLAIYELYRKLNINAITAGEYDSLHITADLFDRMMTTSEQYDWMGTLLYNKCSSVEQE